MRCAGRRLHAVVLLMILPEEKEGQVEKKTRCLGLISNVRCLFVRSHLCVHLDIISKRLPLGCETSIFATRERIVVGNFWPLYVGSFFLITVSLTLVEEHRFISFFGYCYIILT